MKKLPHFLSLAAILMLLFSGCAALDGQSLADDPVSDEGVTALATSRLNSDAMVANATLSVSVENGLATLYGSVPSEAVRQRAIQILKGTEGIFEVLDETRRR